VLWLGLPESLRFLYVKNPRSPQIARIASRLQPDLPSDTTLTFIWSGELLAERRVPVRLLFTAGRWRITLALWLAFFCTQMTLFALSAWLPTLLHGLGVSAGRIARAVVAKEVFGLAGGLLVSRAIDRYGVLPLVALPLAGIPLVALVGSTSNDSPLLLAAVAASGFSVGGSVFCLSAVVGSYYPTAIRSNGVGWSLLASRVGSLLGPMAVGSLLARGASLQTIFFAAAVPLSVATLAILALVRRGLRDAPGPALIVTAK
jgi:AAHS family 4-hydroxybenzoate transporter-like MFS transporter